MHLCSAQASKFLQWIVCLLAGVLLQFYSVWPSVCGVHKGSYIISGTCSLPPHSVQLWLPASLMLAGSTMSHIDASLTLAQQSKSDGQCLSNSSSRNVKRRHRLQP
jgi:hypothetical protein